MPLPRQPVQVREIGLAPRVTLGPGHPCHTVVGDRVCAAPEKGRPKNFLEEKHIGAMADAYRKWKAVEDPAVGRTQQVSSTNKSLTSATRDSLPIEVVLRHTQRLGKSPENR